jgi:hypothetical protein
MKHLTMVLLSIMVCLSVAHAEIPPKEKSLLRYILQNEFIVERSRLDGSKEIADSFRNSSFADILVSLSTTTNQQTRMVIILDLGIQGRGDYDQRKARDAIKRAMQTEQDKWGKLEMARVLSSLGDDTGKDVLISAFKHQGGYMTQSGIEEGKAIIPLLLLDYDFPDGFPKYVFMSEWGGLKEYFDSIRKTKPTKSDADASK